MSNASESRIRDFWSHFLWKLSRLDLALVPTHPDRAGGLGFLEVVHTAFIPLVVEKLIRMFFEGVTGL